MGDTPTIILQQSQSFCLGVLDKKIPGTPEPGTLKIGIFFPEAPTDWSSFSTSRPEDMLRPSETLPKNWAKEETSLQIFTHIRI